MFKAELQEQSALNFENVLFLKVNNQIVHIFS